MSTEYTEVSRFVPYYSPLALTFDAVTGVRFVAMLVSPILVSLKTTFFR